LWFSAVQSVVQGEYDVGRRSPYVRAMTIAGNFIAALQQEQRIGNISYETGLHLRHEFRKLGRDASAPTLAAAVVAEIERLGRQAETLRRLRDALLGVE
jgi:hypothetical protein